MNENYDALEKKLSAAKMLRKHISKVCFSHHSLNEAKKLSNEDSNINVELINVILSYINNLVEASIKIIEYGHSDFKFEAD